MPPASPSGLKWILAPLLIAWLGIGCGTAQVKVHQYVEDGTAFPQSVAILPFTFDPEIPEGKRPHRILREVFFNFFSYLGYTDLPLNEVDHKLNRPAKAGAEPAALSNEQLRQILGTDAVIRGHVINATNFTGGIYSETSIRAKMEMVDLRTGNLIWEAEHNELNNSGIAQPAVVDIIKDQVDNFEVKEAYYKAAESFAIKVLKKVPDPAAKRQETVRLPRITTIETNLQGNKKLKPNDLIYVTLQGDPGLKAYFDIGSFKARLAMKEITPGLYTGSYRVQKGDRIENALIIGCLEGEQGLTAKKFYKEAMAVVEEAKVQTGITP